MNTPPRIVVVGAAGRFGQAMMERFSGVAMPIGLTREDVDLESPESISGALEPLDFEFLILPAALTAVDLCEKEQVAAYAINAEAPRLIAEICARKSAHMTLISTDFVFDGGKLGPYSEDDVPSPVSVYGSSKRKGEENVLAEDAANLVVRVSWLYGPGKPAFPEWIVEKALSEMELKLPADKFGCPTSCIDAADLLVPLLIAEGRTPASGVFHLCNSGSCTWREWGQACLDIVRDAGATLRVESIGGNSLDDVAAFQAKRPSNSALSNSKYTRLTGIKPRHWQEALRDHLLSSACTKRCQAAPCG
ncbi:dTDP-4-dehydrorhamnose reductase [Luteolibacter marinus]|uniref:dTDP-4-dehydrorhamnose reductase n=1 Tax=Luteolibacter marinus TaxID=2776705 RepID=UPI00186654FB|nr:dTDP-4-dehydrorhamnose reductase [Luteolibacter marinus]